MFPVGQVTATAAAVDLVNRADENMSELLIRHMVGDSGSRSAENRMLHIRYVQEGEQAITRYYLGREREGIVFLTRGDRSSTAIMLEAEM